MTAPTFSLVTARSSEDGNLPNCDPTTVRTALISGSFLLRSGFRRILQETSFTLVEECSAVALGALRPVASEIALFIIDTNQPVTRVLEVVRQIRQQYPKARIVALADQFDLGFLQAGHEAGVNGFCLAASEPEVLIASLELVMLGETFVPSAAIRMALEQLCHTHERPHGAGSSLEPVPTDAKGGKLSNREAEILGCLRDGAPNKVIARQLDVTEATVKVHVKSILRKIGAANRTQAAMWANENLRHKDRQPRLKR
jgi:two-component system, NarL family, nitrate/nitrite response regulator NarL